MTGTTPVTASWRHIPAWPALPVAILLTVTSSGAERLQRILYIRRGGVDQLNGPLPHAPRVRSTRSGKSTVFSDGWIDVVFESAAEVAADDEERMRERESGGGHEVLAQRGRGEERGTQPPNLDLAATPPRFGEVVSLSLSLSLPLCRHRLCL